MRKTISKSILSLLVIAFLVFGNPYLKERLENDPYREDRSYKGIIRIWHVVEFKPFRGSIGSALQNAAKRVETNEHGVFFEVKAMDKTEYEARKARGESPDMISFSYDKKNDWAFLPLNPDLELLLPEMWRGKGYDPLSNTCKALPYTASKRAILFNTALLQDLQIHVEGTAVGKNELNEIIDSAERELIKNDRKNIYLAAGDAEFLKSVGITAEVCEQDEFREGKALLAAGDLRMVNETQNRVNNGKAPAFLPAAFEGEEDLVQFIGIHAKIEPEKVLYAEAFIKILFDDSVQREFVSLGLISPYAAIMEETEEEDMLLRDHRNSFHEKRIRSLFE